ncbi:MAG: response regulator [Desulfobulbaceae bacterium]|nr:response regulator [Desulfobulbaceae bacterium]
MLPTAEDILKDQDSLLILPKGNISSQLCTEIVDKKIVLIDDNPVITRLYTRLFQKAGYETFSSATGEQGLELILKEKPDAAVIDFHLPDMSGAEICKEIRRNVPDSDIRLFLFTGDTQASTKESALAAGADAVVVKSPEAEEIVNLVSQHLY